MTGLPTSRWTALGTTASVAACEARALGPARVEVELELAHIDLSCSRFREDSDLSHLNAMAGRPPSVGPLLFEAILAALRAAELTDGAVDPTIGEALFLLGYDQDFSLGHAGARPPRCRPGACPAGGGVSVDRTTAR